MYPSTVDVEGGDTKRVGAPSAGALAFELLERFPAGMVIAVEGADGDDGQMRRDACEEGRNGGRLAAVVADFEQV